jgi:hypothetical protein
MLISWAEAVDLPAMEQVSGLGFLVLTELQSHTSQRVDSAE